MKMNVVEESDLAACVRKALEKYFQDLDGEPASNVYGMVLHCVERPILQVVLDRAGGNQSRAAEILGINRNTLRKKMQQHGIK
jgi:Fis family transcriptional regulator, factor for inversion stimulation protein